MRVKIRELRKLEYLYEGEDKGIKELGYLYEGIRELRKLGYPYEGKNRRTREVGISL